LTDLNINWHKLKDTEYWTVSLTGAKYGNKKLKHTTNKAIIDSGSSYIIMNQRDFKAFTSIVEEDES
jgi:hypothetical protein